MKKMNSEADAIELFSRDGDVRRFIESEDGWWYLEGSAAGWGFSTDPERAYYTSMDPPSGPHVSLGSQVTTTHGHSRTAVSIRFVGDQLMIMLMLS